MACARFLLVGFLAFAAVATAAAQGELQHPPLQAQPLGLPGELSPGSGQLGGFWAPGPLSVAPAGGLPPVAGASGQPTGRPRSWREHGLRWLPTVLLVGTSLAVDQLVDPPDEARFAGRNGFDSEFQDLLAGRSRRVRQGARTASDFLQWTLRGALVADWLLLREDLDSLDSVRVDVAWYFANNLATRLAKVGAGRERPYVRRCATNPDYVSYCGDAGDANSSFFSGHASGSATLAGLLCARHLNRPERTWWDVTVCGTSTAAAAATGVLRITAEKHNATDVLAGWLSGALFGYFLPTRFHYGNSAAGGNAVAAITPLVDTQRFGLVYAIEF